LSLTRRGEQIVVLNHDTLTAIGVPKTQAVHRGAGLAAIYAERRADRVTLPRMCDI
jgi:hypothetical protein